MSFSNVVFAAQHKNYPIYQDLPTGWSFAAKDADSDIEVKDGYIKMTSQKTSKGSTYGQLYTDSFTFEGMQVVSMKTKIDSATGYFKRLYLNNGTDKDLLLVIADGVMTSGDIEKNVPVDEFFDLHLGIDVNSEKVHYWINSEYIGEASIDFDDYVNESVYLHFWNGFTSKTISTSWYISEFERIENAEYKINSIPESGSSFIDISLIDKIKLDFDTVIPNLKDKTIKLEVADLSDMVYSEIDFKLDGNDHSLEIAPTDGFKELKSYRLTVNVGVDVFNVNHTEDYVLEFTTASAGYEAPQCKIFSEYADKEIIVGEMVDISADISEGSSPIVKAELYRNDELVYIATDNFDFEVDILIGINEFYLKVYDEEGGSVNSNVITVTGKENEAPVIMPDLTEISVKPGDKLEFSASDADGEVTGMSLRFDGKKIAEIEGNKAEWSVPEDVVLGKHELEVCAIDNHNLMSSKTVSISVEMYSSSEKVNADYSKFNGTLTGGTMEIANGVMACPKPNDSSKNNYIQGGPIDDEHPNCVIMGADTKTSGNTSWCGISAFTDTTRPSGIVVIETDMYISSKHTLSSLFIQDADTRVTCTVVQFYKDVVYYFDGSTNYTLPLETEKWYDIRLEINLPKGTYSLWLNNEKIMENNKLRDNVKKLTCVRWEFYNYETSPGYAAHSKFIISETVAYPTMDRVRYECEGVESDSDTADTFILRLTSPIDGKTIITKDFNLFIENKEIDFKSYEIVDGEIFVTLKYPVEQGCRYNAELVYLINGTEYKTSYGFESKITDIGIKDYSYAINNRKIYADIDIQSKETTTATVIIVKFENKILKEIKSSTISLLAGQNSIKTPAVSYDSGDNVMYKVYLWNNLTDRISVCSKIPGFTN